MSRTRDVGGFDAKSPSTCVNPTDMNTPRFVDFYLHACLMPLLFRNQNRTAQTFVFGKQYWIQPSTTAFSAYVTCAFNGKIPCLLEVMRYCFPNPKVSTSGCLHTSFVEGPPHASWSTRGHPFCEAAQKKRVLAGSLLNSYWRRAGDSPGGVRRPRLAAARPRLARCAGQCSALPQLRAPNGVRIRAAATKKRVLAGSLLNSYWRRAGDSNPRWACGPYSLSRRAPSASRSALRNS